MTFFQWTYLNYSGEKMSIERLETVKVKMAEARATFQGFLEGLTDEQWATEVYSEGDVWSIKDIVGHVVRAEFSMMRLMEGFMVGHPGAGEDFDLARYNASGVAKLKGKMPADHLSDMTSTREKLLTFLDTLTEADLDKSGRHGTGRIMTIEEMLYVIVGHDAAHMADMKAALA
jgi:uncharacterized damage-inducible protein DinB